MGDDPPEGGDAPVHFEVPKVEAHRGEMVSVKFRVQTDAPLALAAFSLEFEPGAVEFDHASPAQDGQHLLDQNPGGSFFEAFHDEGTNWVQVSFVADFEARDTFAIPAGALDITELSFHVKADAQAGEHPLRFTRDDAAGYDGHFQDHRPRGEHPAAVSAGAVACRR